MPVSSVCEWVQSYRKLTTPHDATLDVSSTCAVVWGPAAPHAVVNTRASAARPRPTQPTASARSSHRAGWWSQRGPCRSCFLGRLGRRWLSSWLRSAARPPLLAGYLRAMSWGNRLLAAGGIPMGIGSWRLSGCCLGQVLAGRRRVVRYMATAWLMVVASVGVLAWGE